MNKAHRNLACAAVAVLLAASGSALAADKIKEPAPVYASGLSHELTQATLHANYAATATTIEEVQHHLHHVINCLVGPDAPGFIADAMNPCHGMGKGAIPDTSDPALQMNLERVLEHAQAALTTENFVLAKDAARIALWTMMTSE